MWGGTHLYTWVERRTVRVSNNITLMQWLSSNSWSLHVQLALTIRPIHLFSWLLVLLGQRKQRFILLGTIASRIFVVFQHYQEVPFKFWKLFAIIVICCTFSLKLQQNEMLRSFLASCSDPGVPQNGRRIGSNFAHGSKVTFVCFQEFSLAGSQSTTCHDGRWSSVVPVCKGDTSK